MVFALSLARQQFAGTREDRPHFIKTGLIEAKYSDIYGAVMEDRAEGHYNLEFEPDAVQAEHDMARARRFLARAEHALLEMGILP